MLFPGTIQLFNAVELNEILYLYKSMNGNTL